MSPLGDGSAWWALAAGLVAVGLRALAVYRARAARARVADDESWRRLTEAPGGALRAVSRAAALAAGAALVAASLVAADGPSPPEAGQGEGPEPRSVILLDLSASMRATDVGRGRSRVARASELAARVAERTPGRLALLAFAGSATVVVPMTSDTRAVARELRSTVWGEATGGGSRPGAGLRSAARRLGTDTAAARRVVLLTDGEDPAGELMGAARELGAQGVELRIVGVGSREGGRIPAGDGAGGPRSWLTDAGGAPVVSRLHRSRLRRAADAADGRYVDVVDGRPADLAAPRSESASGPAVGDRGPAPLRWALVAAFGLLWAEGFLGRLRPGGGPAP